MRNEKEIMGAFIQKCKNINLRNRVEINSIEQDLKDIFAYEIEIMSQKYGEKAKNIAPLNFMDSYTIKDVDAVCGYERSNPPIINLGRKKLYENLNGSKQKREEAAKQILIHLLHEIYHHEQKMIMETQPYTKEGAELIADSKARSARSIGYNFYQKNYWSMPIELGATENAIMRYQEVMGKDEKLNDRMELYRAHKETSMYNYGARLQEKGDVWYTLIQGNKQTPEQIYKTMKKNESAIMNNSKIAQYRKRELVNGIRELCYENLYRALKNSSKEQIAQFEENCGKENINEIYKKMYSYFEKEKERKVNCAKTKKNMLEKIHSYKGIVAAEMDERKPEEASLSDIYRIKKYYTEKQKYITALGKDKDISIDTYEIDDSLEEKDRLVAYYARRAREKEERKKSKKVSKKKNKSKNKNKKSKKSNKKSKNAKLEKLIEMKKTLENLSAELENELENLKNLRDTLESLTPEDIKAVRENEELWDKIKKLRKSLQERNNTHKEEESYKEPHIR